jgi:hypothetical protein
MKTTFFLITTISLGILTTAADNCRYVTVTMTNTASPTVFQIQQGETAEILTCAGPGTVYEAYTYHVTVEKDGTYFRGYPPGYPTFNNMPHPRGSVVVGPATLRQDGIPTVLTLKITPDAYDVNKTLILPPGTNQVYVALESSTNLVNWADATNGVYGSPDVARFFRIRMETLH